MKKNLSVIVILSLSVIVISSLSVIVITIRDSILYIHLSINIKNKLITEKFYKSNKILILFFINYKK